VLVRRLVVASKFLWAQTLEDPPLESGPTAEAKMHQDSEPLKRLGTPENLLMDNRSTFRREERQSDGKGEACPQGLKLGRCRRSFVAQTVGCRDEMRSTDRGPPVELRCATAPTELQTHQLTATMQVNGENEKVTELRPCCRTCYNIFCYRRWEHWH
jgi:hypothetical protein